MKPILFNTPMVKAILDGSKSMSRRMKGLETFNASPSEWEFSRLLYNSKLGLQAFFNPKGEDKKLYGAKCPFGNIGDILYVRETWAMCYYIAAEYLLVGGREFSHYVYKADDSNLRNYFKWRSSLHMPKSAARIRLEIVDIKVERLQDITENDADAEGIKELDPWPETPSRKRYQLYGWPWVSGDDSRVSDSIFSFYSLWCSIYGDDAVRVNPWVWVIIFKRIKP